MTSSPSHGIILVGGARSHQENYAAALYAAGCTLLAVGVAPDLGGNERARHSELAESLGLPLLPLQDAVALPGATIASVCVSMKHRAQVASFCAKAGLHLYLDKPLAGSPVEAAVIAEAVINAGVRAQVFSHAAAPWAQSARAAIEEGRIGRLCAVHGDMLMAKGVPSSLPSDRRREHREPANFPDDIAKRELADMGIYPVSLAATLVGSRATSVQAVTANHFFAEHRVRDVEDYGAMLVDFKGGVTATITCGRVGWHTWRRPYLARVILVGDRDTLIFDSDPTELLVANSQGVVPPLLHPEDPMEMWLSTRAVHRPSALISSVVLDANAAQDAAAFVAALSGEPQVGITVDEAAHHCAIIAAAYRSSAEERPVAVED